MKSKDPGTWSHLLVQVSAPPFASGSFCWYAEHIRGWLMWKFKSHLCSFRLDKLYVPQYFLSKSNRWDVSNTFIKGAADPAVDDCHFSPLSDSHLVGQAVRTAGLWGPVVLKVNLQRFRFPAPLSLSQLQNQLKLPELVSMNLEAAEVLAEYYCSCFFDQRLWLPLRC